MEYIETTKQKQKDLAGLILIAVLFGFVLGLIASILFIH